MVWNELEIRMNRSRPTHTGAQLREPHPGFTTKFKLLERMKYKLSFLHPGVACTFMASGEMSFYLSDAFSIFQQLHFPLG
jgi:hypothetical protein